jgi:hypothetical protein
LSKFSNDYPNFLNEIFPGLLPQLTLLNEWFSLFIEETTLVTIKTLDKSILTWTIVKYETKTHSIFSSHTNKTVNIKVKHATDIADLAKYKISFLPGFVHSLDGAFMRLLILEVFNLIKQKHPKSNGYIINHLHDSIQIHPNFLEYCYTAIFNLYSSKIFLNIANDLFFDYALKNIPEDK